MNAHELIALAPLGAVISFTDNAPQPPARFNKKLAAWQNNNASGYLTTVRKKLTDKEWDTDHFTLRTSTSRFVCINRTFLAASALSFTVTEMPKPGTILAYSEYSEYIEIAHKWESIAEALHWATENKYDLRKYGRKHFIVAADGKLTPWNAEEAYTS